MALPKKVGPLRVMADTIALAITAHQADMALPADAGAALATANGRLQTAAEAHDTNRANLATLRLRRRVACKEADRFLTVAAQTLRAYLGTRWTGEWMALGFASGSIRLPAKRDERLQVLARIGEYLTAHPEQEAPAAQITAVKAKALYENVVNTTAAVNEEMHKCRTSAKTLKDAVGVVQNEIRRVSLMLDSILTPDDSAWTAFGFDMPIAKSLPSKPESVEAQQTVPGTVLVRWNRAVRAARYRVYVLAEGETEPKAATTVDGLLAEITGLPAAVKLIFTVTAANAAGGGPESDPVEITLQ